MVLEILSFTFFAILIGFRHGMDSDHVAAIADMVGAEKQRKRQLQMGIMYALGHGAIVLVIGMLAVMIGTKLPDSILHTMEFLVGLSLLVLGGFILWSIFQQREAYEYQSRWELIIQMVARMFRIKTNRTQIQKMGILSAFCIGILHGIGAETPTQVMLIGSSVGMDNFLFASIQILLFTVGLLIATVLVTFAASWGFMKAALKRRVQLLLGTLTGGYSLVLGFMIIQSM
ncbi:HoxN/HupN/NixA family nickel/cobalt transporter [Brevibacillus migulae]|uniref:HoxN/HupN/NixA family nickel/cobalt transporter n=1 Tax=Brevibacillus migulae TaxID=1644114 RepID=UPI00143113BE|nr:High-affinity nickel-transporter [Brevibacillus migulae]